MQDRRVPHSHVESLWPICEEYLQPYHTLSGLAVSRSVGKMLLVVPQTVGCQNTYVSQAAEDDLRAHQTYTCLGIQYTR